MYFPGGLFLLLCCFFAANAGAQQVNEARNLNLRFSEARKSTFGEQVPPFLREAPAPSTAVVDGVARPIPRFTSGINPKVYSTLMLLQPKRSMLGNYSRLMGLNLFLTHPYLENFDDAPNRLPVMQGLRGPNARFDYRSAQPHLAFFCRMEINESRGNIIPAKFRLGGHRHWQDNLLRR